MLPAQHAGFLPNQTACIIRFCGLPTADWPCFALQMTIAAMVTSMNPSITARQNTGQDSEQVGISPIAPTTLAVHKTPALEAKRQTWSLQT